jgi:hypothetical protein
MKIRNKASERKWADGKSKVVGSLFEYKEDIVYE